MEFKTHCQNLGYDKIAIVEHLIDYYRTHTDLEYVISNSEYSHFVLHHQLQKGVWDDSYTSSFFKDPMLVVQYHTHVPEDIIHQNLSTCQTSIKLFLMKRYAKNEAAIEDTFIHTIDKTLSLIQSKRSQYTLSIEDNENYLLTREFEDILTNPLLKTLIEKNDIARKFDTFILSFLYKKERMGGYNLMSSRGIGFCRRLFEEYPEMWQRFVQRSAITWDLLTFLPDGATPDIYPFEPRSKLLSSAIQGFMRDGRRDLLLRYTDTIVKLKVGASGPMHWRYDYAEFMAFPWVSLMHSSDKKVIKWINTLKKEGTFDDVQVLHPICYVKLEYYDLQQQYLLKENINEEKHFSLIQNAQKTLGSDYEHFAQSVGDKFNLKLFLEDYDDFLPEPSVFSNYTIKDWDAWMQYVSLKDNNVVHEMALL